MLKIITTLPTLQSDIRNFYHPAVHHFIVMNAVECGDKMELQWFFCNYTHPCEITTFYCLVNPGDKIPSIRDTVASAWVAEAELADLMDIKIENTTKGFVLEEDSTGGPLRKR